MDVNVQNDADSRFRVVVNCEGQHAIIAEDWLIPAGWQAVEMTGCKAACIDYVDRHWLDIRPMSLINAMERATDTLSQP